jgi:arylformamidase
MPVNEQTVVFPGDAKPVFEPAGTIATTDFIDHVIHINNHLGTHVDAPGHMVEGGKMLTDIPLERFIADAICIDARNNDKLTADLLVNSEVTSDMAVLFYTGAGDRFSNPSYATSYPAIDKQLAVKLIEMGVIMVGVDMISFDQDAPFPIHKTLLGADVLLLENLVNLGAVVDKRFKLYALPINLELEAAPARVIAELS